MITRRQAIASSCAAVMPGFALRFGPAYAQGAPVKAIASFSILADFVRNVGAGRVDVAALVGPNGNAHVYAPSPSDAKKVANAGIVFVNGLGFEGWLDRLVKASGTTAPVVVASKGIKPIERSGEPGAAHEHEHGRADPHAWQSVTNAKIYVANIRDALAALDADGKAVYEANADAYLSKLDALDREVRDVVARIPTDRRRVITSHNAFGYFDAAYGIRFMAPQGVSTESEASARDVAGIITQIRREKAAAVFLENVTDPRLMRQIATETGAKIGGLLYSDALTDQSGDAPTYIDLIRYNVKQLASALIS
jgi:zinc/manganese transport system substrate-binding protein